MSEIADVQIWDQKGGSGLQVPGILVGLPSTIRGLAEERIDFSPFLSTDAIISFRWGGIFEKSF